MVTVKAALNVATAQVFLTKPNHDEKYTVQVPRVLVKFLDNVKNIKLLQELRDVILKQPSTSIYVSILYVCDLL